MLKINCLLFTVALSFISLFLFKTEGRLAYKPANHSHDIKIDHSINKCAISTNNSLVEFLSFDKLKKQNQINYLESFKSLNKVLVENNSRYLKTCDFLELNLTIHKKIFPFHSFL
jgi:hypothetical protein